MAEAKAKSGWTDAEKLGLLFQFIDKAGPLSWDGIKLPEGRTKKACTVMLDKERKKVRDAAGEGGDGEGDGEGGGAKRGPKRKAASEAAAPKKAKAPRKKKEVKAEPTEEDETEGDKVEEDDMPVKAEEGDDSS